HAFTLTTPATIIGAVDAPANGRLSTSATFSLAVNGAVAVPVTVTFASTQTNNTRAQLVSDVQAALDAALGAGLIQAKLFGNRLVLETVASSASASLAVSGADTVSGVELGLANGQSNTGSALNRSTNYQGLTLDSPEDTDWYQFTLGPNAT